MGNALLLEYLYALVMIGLQADSALGIEVMAVFPASSRTTAAAVVSGSYACISTSARETLSNFMLTFTGWADRAALAAARNVMAAEMNGMALMELVLCRSSNIANIRKRESCLSRGFGSDCPNV